jgi:hypothetical protein
MSSQRDSPKEPKKYGMQILNKLIKNADNSRYNSSNVLPEIVEVKRKVSQSTKGLSIVNIRKTSSASEYDNDDIKGNTVIDDDRKTINKDSSRYDNKVTGKESKKSLFEKDTKDSEDSNRNKKSKKEETKVVKNIKNQVEKKSNRCFLFKCFGF